MNADQQSAADRAQLQSLARAIKAGRNDDMAPARKLFSSIARQDGRREALDFWRELRECIARER